MLFSINELEGLEIAARDGTIGKVRQVYFDDGLWTVRHLVVATGSWLSGRDVLISPHAVERVDLEARQVVVALTRSRVEKAPDIAMDKPVSRQQEARYYDYYGYPYYWAGAGLWGAAAFPLPVAGSLPPAADEAGRPTAAAQPQRAEEDKGDPHLRSSAEVSGYAVEATDGSIGHVDDFLIDPQSWAIRHLVVDTRNWLPGRKVLVDPSSVQDVDWGARNVRVNLTREQVKAGPEYRPHHRAAA